MKKNLVNNFVRKIMIGLLALALTLSNICFWPGDVGEVRAGTVSEEATNTERIDITNYKDGTAPKPTDPNHKGWIFAGWFEDEACAEPLDRGTASGSCIAKFVPAEVLSAMCQLPKDFAESDDTTKLRIVSTVDSLYYQEVGFLIKIGTKEYTYSSKDVYKKITSESDGTTFSHEPNEFDSKSTYFITTTLINIPSKGFSTGIFITPYWKTLDGTTVRGVSRYARVEDGYLNIVNVPVRLYSDTEVAAGYLEVDYNEAIFKYIGYDTGNVFNEMEADATDSDTTPGEIVYCAGNVKDISNNVKADGLYANLRFQIVDSQEFSNGNAFTFTVSNEAFCSKEETVMELDISDVVYKNINKQ